MDVEALLNQHDLEKAVLPLEVPVSQSAMPLPFIILPWEGQGSAWELRARTTEPGDSPWSSEPVV